MKLSPELLEQGVALSNTFNKKKGETRESFLARAVHVSVTAKQITSMDNLVLCRNISVLYLYDNKIKEIQGLQHCLNVKRLYLQNNEIEKIQGLDVGLQCLQVLYLGHNKIKSVAGLKKLPALTVLYLDHQYLDEGEALEFTRDCFSDLPQLTTLSAIQCRIQDVSQIALVGELKILCLTGNSIDDWVACFHSNRTGLLSGPRILQKARNLVFER